MSTPSRSTDHNLLFGLLALKMDLLTRDQLLDGMSAWMDRKHDSLGDVLHERGALSAADRQAIDLLLERHIARHGDAARSLAALHVEADLRRQLEQSTDDGVRHSLAAVTPPPALGEGPGAEGPLPAAVPCRYRRLREHARGGLGEVHVALDEELNREVALKEIRPEHADLVASRLRFVREAEITGGLEHPGVVPVYGLGAYPDGRPYYAMRFIRGETLHDALARFHYADDGRRDAGERELSLRGLLGRFVAVCYAVAYAHSRGVIHRDLKPANVMVGEFGETLVVDWGLAKALDQPEERTTAERPLAVLSTDSAPTEMGKAIGTPGFMPREQALGQHDRVGPASDVFALGATLYCLITGAAPYSGSEALARAARGEHRPARELNPRVPRALDAVCAKAMALAPEERYASARLLAGDVERFLADEPVSVGREPLAQRARRWAKRNRTLVTSAVVLLAASVVGLGAGLYAVGAEKAKTEEALASAEEARDEADRRRVEEEKAKGEATTRRREAEGNLARAITAEASAKASLALAETNLNLAKKAVDETFGIAKDHRLLKGPEISPSLRELRKVLLEKALPFYQDFRAQRPGDPDALYQAAMQHQRVADIHRMLGQRAEALKHYAEAERGLRRLLKAQPGKPAFLNDLATLLNNDAILRTDPQDWKRARDALAEAANLYRLILAQHPDDLPRQYFLANTLGNLGRAEFFRGQFAAADKIIAEAIAIHRRVIKQEPGDPEYKNALANALLNLAFTKMYLGQGKERAELLHEAVAVGRQAVKASPDHPEYHSGLAFALFHLGNLHLSNRRPKEALESYSDAARTYRALTITHPDVPAYQHRLAMVLNNLANVQDDLGQPLEAIKTCGESIEIVRRLLKGPSRTPFDQQALIKALLNRGLIRWQQRQLEGARDDINDAIDLLVAEQKRDPKRRPDAREMGTAHFRRALVFADLKEHRQALADWDRALELIPSGASTFRPYRALCLAHLGEHDRAVAEITAVLRDPRPTTAAGYNAACVFAVTAAGVRADAKRPLPVRERLAEAHARQAVALLQQLAKASYFKAPAALAHLDKDTDLASLRGRDDYKRFRAGLPPAAKPKP